MSTSTPARERFIRKSYVAVGKPHELALPKQARVLTNRGTRKWADLALVRKDGDEFGFYGLGSDGTLVVANSDAIPSDPGSKTRARCLLIGHHGVTVEAKAGSTFASNIWGAVGGGRRDAHASVSTLVLRSAEYRKLKEEERQILVDNGLLQETDDEAQPQLPGGEAPQSRWDLSRIGHALRAHQNRQQEMRRMHGIIDAHSTRLQTMPERIGNLSAKVATGAMTAGAGAYTAFAGLRVLWDGGVLMVTGDADFTTLAELGLAAAATTASAIATGKIHKYGLRFVPLEHARAAAVPKSPKENKGVKKPGAAPS